MKLLNKEGKEVDKLDFGIVEVGKTKELVYYVNNDTNAKVIDIKIEISNKEVDVINYPKTLEPQSKGELIVRWSPPLKVKKGLQTIVKITGTELWS